MASVRALATRLENASLFIMQFYIARRMLVHRHTHGIKMVQVIALLRARDCRYDGWKEAKAASG